MRRVRIAADCRDATHDGHSNFRIPYCRKRSTFSKRKLCVRNLREETDMPKKILVAYDGSEQARKAFTYALEVVKNCPAPQPEIRVVAVAQPPEPPDLFDDVIDMATDHFQEHFRELHQLAKDSELTIITEAAVGHPAEYIIRYAKDSGIDTIFVGHTGRSRIETWLLGSVSKRIATYAHCTVTIVR